jgi:GH15 family glucan-1,4-alpha-glucosidase
MAKTQPASPARSPAQTRRTDGFLPIEDYGAIGDGRTVVLSGIDGSIDWMCAPEIDSPSLFGALLDPTDGGSFSLAPAGPFEVERRYLPQTNVLQTDYTTSAGAVRVTEALTIDPSQSAPWRELVREVQGLSGSVSMQWRLRPRFEYGRTAVSPGRFEDFIVYRHGRLQLGLRTWEAGTPALDGEVVSGSFEISADQRATLVLVASDDAAVPRPQREAVRRRLSSTEALWRDWVSRSSYRGPWQEAVERSLLALRLLADGRSGAITAAGTTSLPEQIGGQRNFDYRFGWVRDLSFTVDALLEVGMDELAHASVNWLLESVGHTRPRVDPVYALTTQVIRSQRQLPLAGYRGSTPVLVGNQAGSQLQLGGFGDLIETVHRFVGCGHVLAEEAGERIADSIDLLCSIWRQEDAGLWELGDYAQYATSKLSCWTAFRRGVELAERGQLPDRHAERWRRELVAVHQYIEAHLWSERRQSYVMKAGSEMLDCGVLLAARRGYLEPGSPKLTSTIDAIQRELHAEGPLLYRYSGMQDQENAFLACSFWMVEALALAGRGEEARETMDQMVRLTEPLGLASEEMEPGTHAMRGNFPQALTHLALISAAAIYVRTSEGR